MSKAPKRRRRSCAVCRVLLAATAANHVWSMDFMHDRLAGDHHRSFRLLTIVNIFTRECLALEVATGFRARNVVHALSRLVAKRGAPISIRCDQGTEFTAEALEQWAYN
ncbi:MAG: DDE-type integrase/transposase/recombinase, partial [Candidatus Cybelea sp.]